MQFTLRAALLAGALGLTGSASWAETVTLEQAIERALGAAPELQAAEAGTDAARGALIQAGTRPNPSVTLEGENVAGTGVYGPFDQSEFTVTYSQPIERGGKRDARIAFAERGIAVSTARARVARLDLAARVESAYIDVLIARETVRIAEFRLSTEQEMHTEALRRVRGYKDPLFVESRANARVAQARLALSEAQADYVRVRALLSSYIGIPAGEIDVTGQILLPVSDAKLAQADAALADAEVERARASVVVEQSHAAQDYTLSGGVRYLRGTNDVALLGGITIPLGRFDRNQGNIAGARAERQRLEFEAEASRLERLRRLASLRAEADAARVRADGIIGEVFPQAIKTLDLVREGYNRGGFNFRDVQDAADAILEVQEQWVAAMTRYRDLISEIDRLTGRFDVAAGEEQAQ